MRKIFLFCIFFSTRSFPRQPDSYYTEWKPIFFIKQTCTQQCLRSATSTRRRRSNRSPEMLKKLSRKLCDPHCRGHPYLHSRIQSRRMRRHLGPSSSSSICDQHGRRRRGRLRQHGTRDRGGGDQLVHEGDVGDGQAEGLYAREALLVGEGGNLVAQAVEGLVQVEHSASLADVGRPALLDGRHAPTLLRGLVALPNCIQNLG